MEAMEARNCRLPDWMTRVRTRQLVLPRFQRMEAWGYQEVTDLLQSVIRELPAGAVLVLEVGDELPFVSRPLETAPDKGDDWPSDDPLTDDMGYLDPCQHDYVGHFESNPATGLVEGLTPPARYMIEQLHLNRRHLIKLRQKREQEEAIHQRLQQICQETLEMVASSLQDDSLPAHAIQSLRASQGLITLFWEQHQQWWERRWEPPYTQDDLR